MAVGSVQICLTGSFRDDRGVTTERFLTPLNIQPDEEVESSRADGGKWQSGVVYFPVTRLRDFATAEEPSEAFFAQLKQRLLAIARFLDNRPPAVTVALRSSGMELRLIIDVWMDQDQMELELPPELLAACSRHGLPVYIISNDFSAAEVLEWRSV